jgi:hypothetical protein
VLSKGCKKPLAIDAYITATSASIWHMVVEAFFAAEGPFPRWNRGHPAFGTPEKFLKFFLKMLVTIVNFVLRFHIIEDQSP